MDLNDNGEGGIWVFDEVELPDGWTFDRLGNRCTVRRGSSPRPAGHPRYFGGGTIPWIKIGDATNTGSRFIGRTAEHVNEEGAKCSVQIPAGSLIIANSGVSLGFAAITRVPGCIHDGWLLTTDFRELDRDYLYYCINVATRRLRQLADGTTQPNLNTGIARRLMLPLPPLAEQKAIAAVLGALDDKIELNRRMNATLEAMARALFQSWFVDFDPVRAKLDGRQPPGLDPATASLFPNEFEDSELGHIPRGWIIKPVGEVVDCVGGGTPSTTEPKYWKDGTHHWTTPKDFSSLQAPVLLDTDRRLSDAGIAKISSGLLPAGTLLLSSRAPVGYLAIAAMPVAINQGFIAMKCNERASNFFMLNWCETNMAEIKGRATGTTFAEISKQNFRPIPVVLPKKEVMAAFSAKVGSLYAQITANLQQSRILIKLRDTVLPKLLAGELRTVTPA